MLGIHHYLYRLIPANPILLRVVDSGGKRRRDLFIRSGYLGLLVAFVVISLMTASGDLGGGSLSSLAKTSAALFQKMSYLQLGLVALLAPVFTAGAITQEKDSQTYDILLATPLTNGQIVLGSLLSRLFFIIALLISGIPVFSITQIFGGVAIKSITISFLIAAATAFATGALAMAIATFKVGTRRTIFSFYLFIVVYMAGGIVLDSFEQFHIKGRTVVQGVSSHISWFTAFNPFLALRVIFKDPTYAPPAFEDLPDGQKSWPIGYMLSNPTSFYISFMFVFSLVLVTPSILLLRRMAQSSNTLKTAILQKLKITTGNRTRKPRLVWTNPIAWREARTKASAAKATLLRYSFIIIGLSVAIYLVFTYATTTMPANSIVPSSYNDQQSQITLPPMDGKGIPRTLKVMTNLGSRVIVPSDDPDVAAEVIDLRKFQGVLEVVSYTTFKEEPPTDEYVSRRIGPRPESVLRTLTVRPPARGLDAALARKYLLGLCGVEFAVILLIVTNAAASTVTREKEDGTLDLLLSSPITSRYYIWGKLRGLVSFVLPLVAVPVASVGLFIIYDIFQQMGAGGSDLFQWLVFPEAVILMPGMLVIICAFAAILGMQMSLRCRTTVTAVMSSVGIVVGICAAMGWCGYSFLNSSNNPLALIVGSFSPFTLMQMQIDPYASAGQNFRGLSPESLFSARMTVGIVTIVAVGIYVAIVWQMYAGMVKNFDMTIRKQSR